MRATNTSAGEVQINAGPGGYGPPGGGGYGQPPGGGGYGQPPGGGGYGQPPVGGGYGPPPGGGGYGPPGAPPPGYGPPPGGQPGGYGPPPGFGPPQGFGPPGMVGPPPGFGGGQPKTHGLAIASMVCGIVAIVPGCCCGAFGLPIPIAAIVMGIVALQKVKAMPMQHKGGGMAIAGIICASVAMLLDIGMLFTSLDEQYRQNLGY